MNRKVHISECCFCVAVLVLARVAKGRFAGQVGLDMVAPFYSPLHWVQIPYHELLGEVPPALSIAVSHEVLSFQSSESPIVGVTFQPSIIIFVTPHNILFLAKSA